MSRRHGIDLRRAWIVSALVLLLLAPAAISARTDESARLARCAAIPDDARRLACYDELARSSAPTAPTGWQLVEAGEPTGPRLSVRAVKPIHGKGTTLLPSLALACPGGEFEASVQTGMAAASEYGGDEKTAVLRFDRDDPFTELLTESENRDALYFPSPLMVASQLLRHDLLFFQFMPEGARPASVVFDLRGLDEAIAPLLESCRLTLADDGILEPAP